MTDPPNLSNPGKPRKHRLDTNGPAKSGRLSNLSYPERSFQVRAKLAGKPLTFLLRLDRLDRLDKQAKSGRFPVANLSRRGLPGQPGRFATAFHHEQNPIARRGDAIPPAHGTLSADAECQGLATIRCAGTGGPLSEVEQSPTRKTRAAIAGLWRRKSSCHGPARLNEYSGTGPGPGIEGDGNPLAAEV